MTSSPRVRTWISLSVASLTLLAAASSAGASELERRFRERVEALRDDLIELRRDLHRHPEVSGEEVRTARVVAERLEALGLEVRRGVGGHGVPFASEVPGVRHICGHDVHTAVGVALAEGLASVGGELEGSVLFVFQPAEESAIGAKAMIADGALDDPTPEAIFAFHTSPFETGRVATARSVMMSSRDRVTIDIAGAGDRAGVAKQVERMVESLTTVRSPTDRQPAGSEFIFAQARVHEASRVNGFITTATRAASERAHREITRAVAEIEAEQPDVRLTLDYEPRALAGVTNDPRRVERAGESARRVVGDDGLVWLEGVVPAFSEDFGSFQDEVAGVMFFLGVSNAANGWVGMPHTPGYVADEEAIFVGANVMGAVVLDYIDLAAAR